MSGDKPPVSPEEPSILENDQDAEQSRQPLQVKKETLRKLTRKDLMTAQGALNDRCSQGTLRD
ncbi:MAG: hypothetical protein U1A78_09810 [Polyangia bacterium]